MSMTLASYHDALVDGIRAHFGDSLQTVQAYFPAWQSEQPDAGLQIDTPAVLVEIERMEAGIDDDRGDGTNAVLCHVAIHCVLGSQTEHLQRELRVFAAAMMRLVRHRQWCSGCDGTAEPENVQALPGIFRHGQAGYDSFVVAFEQAVYLGESVFQPTQAPQAVLFGQVL